MELTKGTKIKMNGIVMVITGETKDAYQGYYEYKDRAVGQCSLLKGTLINNHLSKRIERAV